MLQSAAKENKPERVSGDRQRLFFLLRLSWSSLNASGKVTVIVGVSVVFATAYGITLAPLLFAKFIDQFSVKSDVTSTSMVLVAGFLLTYWLSYLGREIVWITAGPVQQRIQRHANSAFFANALALPYDYHVKKSTGGLNEKLVQAQSGMNQIIFSALTDLIPTIAQTCFVIINSLIFLPLYVSALLIGTIVIYLTVLVVGAERIRQQQRQAQKELIGARGLLTDAFLGIEAIKAFGQEKDVARRYDDWLGNAESRFRKFLRIRFALGAAQVTIAALGMSLALGIGVFQIQSGSLSVGALVLIQMYFVQTISPLQGLSLQYRNIKSGLTMLDGIGELFEWRVPRTFETLGSLGSHIVSGVKMNVQQVPVGVRMEDVCVARSDRMLVKDVSLTVNPGEVVAIVGPTGAGKSTLVRLLLRLIEPDEGAIFLGGQPASQIPMEIWRQRITLVPQDVVLFNDTLLANLRFAAPNASRAEVERVVQVCRLDALVSRSKDGLETRVGERGQILSGGERQRVGLARAVLRSPDVFVLDEATSALDRNTEQEILEDLLAMDPRAAKIIITHRLNTVRDADRIYTIENGQIVQTGNHGELSKEEGLYRSLVDAQ